MNKCKKALSLLLALLMTLTLVPFAAVSAADEYYIELVADAEEVNAGDEITVEVSLYGHESLGLIGAQVELGFDPDVFELVTHYDEDEEMWMPPIEVGPKFSASSNKYILFSPIDEETGYMERCLVQFLRPTATTTQAVTTNLFYTVTFRVKDDAPSGTYAIDVIKHNDKNIVFYGLVNKPWTWEPITVTVNGTEPEIPPCPHEYDNDCDATCNLCGETREVGDHVYDHACDTTCNVCGATRSITHDYADATCTEPKTCKICGYEDGEALGHNWIPATCTEPKYCSVCGLSDEGVLGHVYDNACDATCNVCGESREVADHIWSEGTCSVCGAASPSKVTITKEPTTGYAQMGNKVSVKLTAEGEGLRYEWWIKNNGSKKYSKSSVTKATYSTTMSDKAKDRLVFCRVYDQYGNMVQCKTVRLREAVSLTKQPSSQAVYAQSGKKASIKITASGDELKYTWYIKNEGASKYAKSSVTSATYSATMSSKSKGRRVYCVVTDKYGKTVQTKTFILRESVSITTQPKTVTVAKNKTAKVTVKASGDGLKYTWYIKNEGASKYAKSSVTSASYSTTMNAKSKNRLVYCVVTDKYGNTVKTVTVRLKMK